MNFSKKNHEYNKIYKLIVSKNLKQNFILKMIFVFTLSLVLINCSDDDQPKAQWEIEVGQLKNAVEKYKDFNVAKADGYDLDATGYRTQMGHHFLKVANLDKQFDLEKPEVLLYVPDDNEVMQLVAVEYGIAMDDFDNPPPAPEGFTGSEDTWELNSEFQLWTLHVWIELENPNGIFTSRNPMLP